MIPMPRFVADTKTVQIPGITSLSVTVTQALTKDQHEDAFHKKWNYFTCRDTSGKYSIEAKLAENDSQPSSFASETQPKSGLGSSPR